MIIPFAIGTGISFAFAFISFLFAGKSGKPETYTLFGIFSLFSGLYLVSSITDIHPTFTIFFAAIYYSAFAWFISSFTELRKKMLPLLLTATFLLSFVLFHLHPNRSLWQTVAHVGLLGMVIHLVYALLFKFQIDRKIKPDFLIVSAVFIFLSIEEVSNIQFDKPLIGHYLNGMLPLDIFPLLFMLVVGRRIAYEEFYKSKFELELVKGELAESEHKRLEAELDYKQKDLTEFGLEISRNRKFLNELDKAITNPQQSTQTKTLQNLSSRIKAYLSNSESSALIHEKVSEVNHEFINKLKLMYPKLTKNDIQLCLFLRLNLSSKEISAIKHISTDSVKVARHRLRAKLNLSSGANLSSYIQSL